MDGADLKRNQTHGNRNPSTAPQSSRRQRYGRSTIAPASRSPRTASSISNTTRRCCAPFPGSPQGFPNGHLRNSVRGGFTRSATSRTSVRQHVLSPSASQALAIRPTV